MSAQIREEIYYSLERSKLLPEDKKRSCKRTKGTYDLLYIDQPSKKKKKNSEKEKQGGKI